MTRIKSFTRSRIYLPAAILLAAGALMLAACDSAGVSDVSSDEAGSQASETSLDGSTVQTVSKLGSELARVRAAVAPYHTTEAAEAAGHVLLPGVDFCFDNQPVGGMGYHYIDPNEIDTSIDPLEPEAWVFVPGPNGQRVLGAVEYLVSAPDWNATHSEVPNLFGHDFHAEGADLYALHAWIFKHNSLGMFADWNPKVSCP